MKNMTDLLNNHSESLEQASFTAFGIHDSLEKAAKFAQSWSESSVLGSSMGDYAIRIVGPLATVFLGNYGLPPSLTRNALLILSGKQTQLSPKCTMLI